MMPDIDLPVDDPHFLLASLEGLRLQKRRIEEQIRLVERRIATLQSHTAAAPSESGGVNPKRELSAEARLRISQAQKKRWAEFRRTRNGA